MNTFSFFDLSDVQITDIMIYPSIFAFSIVVPRFCDLPFVCKLQWFLFVVFPGTSPIFLFKKKKSQKLHLLGLLVLSVLWGLLTYPLRVELVSSYFVTFLGLQISLDRVCFILFSLKIVVLENKVSKYMLRGSPFSDKITCFWTPCSVLDS